MPKIPKRKKGVRGIVNPLHLTPFNERDLMLTNSINVIDELLCVQIKRPMFDETISFLLPFSRSAVKMNQTYLYRLFINKT